MPEPVSPARRLPAALLVLLLSTLLAACSQPPDHPAIRQALNRQLQQAHLGELFTVIQIDDARSYRHDDNHYTVDVHYTLQAKRDLDAYTQAVKNDPDRGTMDRLAMIVTLSTVRRRFGDFAKGDTFSEKQRISLERTNDGWTAPVPGARPDSNTGPDSGGHPETDSNTTAPPRS